MAKHKDAGNALRVQQHQQRATQRKLGEIEDGTKQLKNNALSNMDELDALMSEFEELTQSDLSTEQQLEATEQMLDVFDSPSDQDTPETKIDTIDTFDVGDSGDWSAFMEQVEGYAERNDIDLTEDPFKHIMSPRQRIELEKRIDEELTHQPPNCDKYDYLLAAGCGAIGGLIDIVFVGAPGETGLSDKADKTVDKCVERFAKLNGWQGAREGSDETKSAIGFLERKYKINYDQTSSNSPNLKVGTDGQVKDLSTKNHHIRSLAHSPDLVGLIFSIYNQFTSTTSFYDDGRVITINSESFELEGHTVIAKIFAGFCNWLGHLFSDVAGSSGAKGRGSGIPIPFFSLLQFIDVGEFGKHKQSFATICVKAFEQGYDFRHGVAMAVPVVLTEVMTRLCWSVKQRVYHQKPWSECIPSGSIPELRRMLLVSHGTLVLADAADAGIRSGGNFLEFLLRSNVIAWMRFANIGLKEAIAFWHQGSLDIDAANERLDAEYERLLAQA